MVFIVYLEIHLSVFYYTEFVHVFAYILSSQFWISKVIRVFSVLEDSFWSVIQILLGPVNALNPFYVTGLFLHTLKTSVNLWVFLCFQAV